ncbi:MAG: hemolysin family protein [Cytophagales bacterium]
MNHEILLLITSLIAISFFSGMEIAFVSSNKLQIELLKQQETSTGKILGFFIKNASKYIGTTMVCNTLAIVIYDQSMTQILEEPLEMFLHNFLGIHNDILEITLHAILATIFVLIVAEFVPKTVFMANPNTMLEFFAYPMQLIYWLMYIPVWLIMLPTKFFIEKILRMEFSEEKPVFGLTDLNHFVANQTPSPEAHEDKVEVDAKIFKNALKFKNTKVKECMRPRTEIVAVDIEDGTEKLYETFIESGHSKILIYKNNIDDVLGYVHSHALFKKPKTIEEVLNPIVIAQEVTSANELLVNFIEQRKSLAIVVDEFGGTAGLVSIEDIIEEIFGEINDEHDEIEHKEFKIDENNYIFSARLEIDYLNDKYNWEIPTGEYDTLGGYLISVIEDIPQVGEVFDVDDFQLTIISKEENKLDKIKLSLKNKANH